MCYSCLPHSSGLAQQQPQSDRVGWRPADSHPETQSITHDHQSGSPLVPSRTSPWPTLPLSLVDHLHQATPLQEVV